MSTVAAEVFDVQTENRGKCIKNQAAIKNNKENMGNAMKVVIMIFYL